MMPTHFRSIYRNTVYRYGILPTIRVTIYRVIAINTKISIYRPALDWILKMFDEMEPR